MKHWKVIIEYEKKTIELIIEALYYSEAYNKARRKFPACVVKEITEIKDHSA